MTSSPHLTRRALAMGAAWTVPAVALAAAAPRVAASGDVIITPDTTFGGKLAGNSCHGVTAQSYIFRIQVCNNTTATVTVWLGDANHQASGYRGHQGTTPTNPVTFDVSPQTVSLTAGQCVSPVYVGVYNAGSSGNISLTATVPYSWSGPGESGASTFFLSADTTPPTDCPD